MMSVILRGSLAYQIRELRLVKGVTQAQVARGIGTKQNVIARLEDPYGHMPSLATLRKVAKYFDVAMKAEFSSWSEFMRLYCSGRPPVTPLPYDKEFST